MNAPSDRPPDWLFWVVFTAVVATGALLSAWQVLGV